MTTVIFVHGTSVREPDFSETLSQVKAEINKELPDVKVIGCSWGSSLGAKLNANGASIPLYDAAKSEKPEVDVEIIRWMQLYQDPLHELKLLTLQEEVPEGDTDFGEDNLSAKLDSKVQEFTPSDELKIQLREARILGIFDEAIKNIVKSDAYTESLKRISEDNITEHRDAIARAIIAQTIEICETEKPSARIMMDAELRDKIVELLANELYKSDFGIRDWLTRQVGVKLAKLSPGAI
jgi:hypothetical protein